MKVPDNINMRFWSVASMVWRSWRRYYDQSLEPRRKRENDRCWWFQSILGCIQKRRRWIVRLYTQTHKWFLCIRCVQKPTIYSKNNTQIIEILLKLLTLSTKTCTLVLSYVLIECVKSYWQFECKFINYYRPRILI